MAELGPTTVYGALVTTGDFTASGINATLSGTNFYVNSTNGIYFNDTNTQIWEDSNDNLSFKDVSTDSPGTTTLKELQVRRAYINTTPSNPDTTLDCDLDDNGGTNVTVTCEIAGTKTLENCIPRVVEGDYIYIIYNLGETRWETLFPFTSSCESDASCV